MTSYKNEPHINRMKSQEKQSNTNPINAFPIGVRCQTENPFLSTLVSHTHIEQISFLSLKSQSSFEWENWEFIVETERNPTKEENIYMKPLST